MDPRAAATTGEEHVKLSHVDAEKLLVVRIARCRARGARETREGTLKTAAGARAESSTSSVETDALTLEEETQILRYHEHKIQSICAAFSLPRKVKNTAVMLFKRFALAHGVAARQFKDYHVDEHLRGVQGGGELHQRG